MTGATSLIDIVHEHLASDDLNLPVFNHVALKLQNMLTQDDYTINQVASMITEDQVLASNVLRMANSSFFSGLNKAATIKDAVVRLGGKQVANIVMMITQKANYGSKNKVISLYMEPLWKHAIGCAIGAKWLAGKLGHKHLSQEAFLAGLLHDIGKLFLLKVLEDIHTSGQYGISLTRAMICEALENMHATQGAILLGKWNLPDVYCDIVRDHHIEDYDTSNDLLGMVRLVNLACHKIGVSLKPDPSIVLAATAEAFSLNIPEILLAELEITIEDALELPC